MPWVRSALNILSANDTTTFNQPLYVSFSHREEPPLILTALGLFNNSEYYPGLDVNTTMPVDRINFDRTWRTSRILPFLGRVGLERMQCSNTAMDDEPFVRVLVNGAPIPIATCQDGPGRSCSLGGFAAYIEERAELYGDFVGACGIKDTVKNRTNLLTIYAA